MNSIDAVGDSAGGRAGNQNLTAKIDPSDHQIDASASTTKSDGLTAPMLPNLFIDTDRDPPRLSATARSEKDISKLSDRDLQCLFFEGYQQGEKGLPGLKSVVDEEIKRAEDPAQIKAYNDYLRRNVVALETGTDEHGKALDASHRLVLHDQNDRLIEALNMGVTMHVYDAYLRNGKNLNDVNANTKDQALDFLKKGNTPLRAAIKDADGMDMDLLMRADTQLNKDLKAGIDHGSLLKNHQRTLDGGYASSGYSGGIIAERVHIRNFLAGQYLQESDRPGCVAAASHLLREARAAKETILGKGGKDRDTEELITLAQQEQADINLAKLP